MSRIIVKNLPKYITLERFKSHFEQKGSITDAKLVKTKEGVFRRFGYIGYKTAHEAQQARDYFHNTFMDTCKLTVEIAKAVNDPALERPWSKYSKGSSAFAKKNHEQEEKERQEQREAQKKEEYKKKEQLLKHLYENETSDKIQEYLNLIKPKKGHIWDNDDGFDLIKNKNPTILKEEDDDLYQDLPKLTQETTEPEEDSGASLSESEDPVPEENSIAFDNSVSDLDYLKSKMAKAPEPVSSQAQNMTGIHPSRLGQMESPGISQDLNTAAISGIHPSRMQQMETTAPLEESSSGIHPSRLAHVDQKIISSEDVTPIKEAKVDPPLEESIAVDIQPVVTLPETEKEIPPAEIIADTGRLFVRNLPYNVEQEELEALFKPFGPLTEVHIPIYKDTKLQKGYAFVLFMLPEHAVTAYSSLDGTIFQGRILEILPGKEKLNKEEEIPEGTSFKLKKEKEQKAEAGNDFNWNSLFMNSDAVIQAMAKKLNVKKSDILNHEGDNMAVRVALAETHIINETKEFLESHGVSLDAFRGRKSRCRNVILVKNLPASTLDHDIYTLFEKFGSLGRVLIPPAKTIALVEFLEPNEAKSAFQKLAYTKFKSVPLFLEWAPLDTFKTAYDPSSMPRPSENVKIALNETKAIKLSETDEVDDPDAMPVATLFVKNLNFSTTEAVLQSCFNGCEGLRKVRIPTKVDKKGQKLSLGYGFLEFSTKENAMTCLKVMQNTTLEGHVLNLKYSNAATKAVQKRPREEAAFMVSQGTKLIVRNIPFEASKKEVRDLFNSFGQVKSMRLPTKFDGSHRGFGFVEFMSKQEASTAYESLGATHLYGRHLVLEWAQDEDSVEAIRLKTAKAFKESDRKRFKVTEDGLSSEEEDE